MSEEATQGSGTDREPVRTDVIAHCEYDCCDLGTLQYKCPLCNYHNVNYDLELYHEAQTKSAIHDVECEECHKTFQIKY